MLCNLKKLFETIDPLHIIAGSSTYLTIDFINEAEGGKPVNLIGASCRYSLSHFATGEPIVSKLCSIVHDMDSPLAAKYPEITYPFTARVILHTAETAGLEGEYIHQFILSDFRNEQQTPCEGRVIVQRSKDPALTSPMWFINVETGGLFASPNSIAVANAHTERVRLFYADSSTQRILSPPYNAIVFTSSDTLVATVENDGARAGYVTGVSSGECVITATVRSKPELTTDISVLVVDI